MQTDVTVIVPTKNETANIGPFLAGLPAGVPVIVVDDSTDGTPQRIVQLRPQQTRVLRRRSTVTEARQIGAEVAETPWLLFTDADVVFADDYFEALPHYLAQPWDAVYGPKLSQHGYETYYRRFSRGQQWAHRLGIPAASAQDGPFAAALHAALYRSGAAAVAVARLGLLARHITAVMGEKEMTVQPNERPLPQSALSKTAVAHGISHLLSPPMLGLTAALLVALALQTAAAWLWAAVYVGVAVLLPAGTVVWLLRSGRVSDIHLNRREERLGPTLVMLGSALLGLLLLLWGRAPRLFLVLAAAQVLQATIFYAITLQWKISAHATSVTAVAALAWYLFAVPVPLLLPVVLSVCWARLTLRRHTPRQILAGAVLGAVTMTAVFLALGPL